MKPNTKRCQKPGCQERFIPIRKNQRYCCLKHKNAAAQHRLRKRIVNA